MSTPRALRRMMTLRGDARGVSAVEFALILPILVLLYLGCVEVSLALTVDRKVTTAGSVVGDLVAQSAKLCTADINNIFDATTSVLTPYPAAPLKIIVSYVTIDDSGAKVVWSEAKNDTKRAAGSKIILPPDVSVAGTDLVVAEVSYLYAPTFGQAIKENLTFADTFYLRPRHTKGVARGC